MKQIKIYFYHLIKKIKYFKANHADYLKLLVENDELVGRLTETETELKTIKESIKKFPIDVNIKDPIPSGSKQRKEYVSEVAGFHINFLKPKLLQMINATHILFEEENLHRQDLMLRGVTHAFREIIRWGDGMVNENMGNQTDDPSLPEKTLEEITKE